MDRIFELQPKPIKILVDLDDPHVTHLGPLPKPKHLPHQEEVGDSEDWEPYNPEYWDLYHFEVFEEWENYPPPTPIFST